ncbi:exo-rhamnogalacturonan lyase family protein [Peristeroidobacter soli]|uniref:exo-rhamnogalacturonan lyase family protein n=1 Tax=Peristeroidobacter soli TaxID=2497877 RepID=UPI00101E0396|nr:Tat pathway signal sequence domain protein [Peristeroidobacter soli]
MAQGISRRQFIAASALATTALSDASSSQAMTRGPTAVLTEETFAQGAWCHWLDDRAPDVATGVTWGMPWPRSKHSPRTSFSLRDREGKPVPLQTWPLAYWPDGSLKWTAHAVAPDVTLASTAFQVEPGQKGPAPAATLKIKQDAGAIEIDTGVITCRVLRHSAVCIESIRRGDKELLAGGRLVALRQNAPLEEADSTVKVETFESLVESAEIEHQGPLRAVIKITGVHARPKGRRWLPFTLRLYFYAGGDDVRVVHTFVFDGEESRDFIRGLGLRFDVPLSEALHNRHVRFVGENDGVFGEAVRGLTGLRRDPGIEARQAQIAGREVKSIGPRVAEGLELIPAFGDWTLLQPTADSFQIRKRTAAGYAWLDSSRGGRASGLGYLGGPSGGVAFGIRNFWESHPAQLDIRKARTERAEVTMWLWAPDAPPMDLRFYHDGLGQDTHEKQLQGLNITYEDYEPGFGTPVGVARTSEMRLWLLEATPARERLVQLAAAVRAPAAMVAVPQTLHRAGVFGGTFALPDRSNAKQARLEEQLDFLFDFYEKQRDQHSWCGFWNYGDVMHTYDADRHTWRYDVGGYAWDNSELSTDIWLWLYFLRTGRADVYRFAEAMTRHTGEVDVHHLGKFAPLGSRHNVMHWGCSAKQLRISTALNRRYYYFLTADERVGDLLREQLEAARTLRAVVPERKLPEAQDRVVESADGDYARLGFGTDWGSIAGAWLTEWERTGSREMRDRLVASMRSIGSQPRGFFTGGGRMNLRTGAFDISNDRALNVSHLSAAFGLPEVCAELIELLKIPEFERAWVEYCMLYNAPPEQQKAVLGESLGELNLGQGHSRLTAYAARIKRDPALAKRAWEEFYAGRAGFAPDQRFETRRIAGPAVMNAVDEAAWVSTNTAAQWGLAAIECLAFTVDLG